MDDGMMDLANHVLAKELPASPFIFMGFVRSRVRYAKVTLGEVRKS